MFNQIISDLRKGCGFDSNADGIIPYICGKTEVYNSPRDDKGKIHLCHTCQAKLNQTLLCEKIAEDENKRLLDFLNIREGVLEDSRKEVYQLVSDLEVEKQKHKDFVEKLKEEIKSHIAGSEKFYDDNPENLLKFIAELESEVKK